MGKKRNVLRVDDVADVLKRKLRAKADALETRTGEPVPIARVARLLLMVAVDNKTVCRQAGVP